MGWRIWVLSRRSALRALAVCGMLMVGAVMVTVPLSRGALIMAQEPGADGAEENGPLPVMIDPGHGGVDGGTSWQGILEKDIVLDVALRLREALHAAGVPAEMTRERDDDLGGPLGRGRHRRDLQERVRRTAECRAVMLVSVHANASRQPHERGMLFLYRNGDAASKELADSLYDALKELHPRRERPIPRSNLFVLNNCQVPAVIVELGFLTNAADRMALTDPAYRQQVAATMSQAIIRYYRQQP